MTNQKRKRLFSAATLVLVAVVCLLIVLAAEVILRIRRASTLDRQIAAIETQLSEPPPPAPSDGQLRNSVVRSNATFPLEQFADGYLGPVIHRPYLGHRQTPSLRVNSLGYRGRDFAVVKPPGVFRILMYGGSFVYGTGAEDDTVTIPAHLERLLNQSGQISQRVEVINCGDLNYCSTQEAVFLLVEGVLLSPDLVIFLDGVNDTAWGYSNLPAGYDGDFFERNHRLRDEPLKTRYTVHELRHLQREREALTRWNTSLLAERAIRLWGSQEAQDTVKMNDDQGALDFNPPHLELVQEYRRPEEYAWRYLLNMRSVRALGKEFGFRSLSFIQPVPVIGKPLNAVEEQRLEQIRAENRWIHHELAYWEDHYNSFADAVLEGAERSGDEVVDLRYIFRDHPEALYIDDCHLRGIGYEYVARRIQQALVAHNVLPD